MPRADFDTMENETMGDEHCVLKFLLDFPDHYVSGTEIARRACGWDRFTEDNHWHEFALNQLVEHNLVETDGGGRYRVIGTKTGANSSAIRFHTSWNACRRPVRKFISPQMRDILEQSKVHFDLSSYD